MKKHFLSVAAAAAAVLAGGCLPDQFVWWSPGGQTAAVRAPDGLRLADTNGQLSAVLLPGEIQSAAWLADGSGLVVSRSVKLTNWPAIEKLIPPSEAAVTRQLARALPDLLKAGLTASGGSAEALSEKFLVPLGMSESPALEPAWFCALSLHSAEIRAVLAGFTNAAALEAEVLSSQTNGLSVYEISRVPFRDGRPAGEAQPLLRSLRPLLDPLPSPRQPVLAFRSGEGALKVLALGNTNQIEVADEDAASATWLADGRSLLYVVMKKSDKVGEIRSRRVVSDGGELLESPPQAATLAMAAFVAGASPRLSVLPDGRVLFASVPISVPARVDSIQPSAQFYLLDPTSPEAAPVAVAIKEGSLPDDLSAFAVSPDGRQVAVVEGATDAVAVVDLAAGKVQIVSPAHDGWKSRMMPAWRNPRELTFAALPTAAAGRPELVCWRPAAPDQILSKEWPDRVVKAWLEGPSASSEKRPR